MKKSLFVLCMCFCFISLSNAQRIGIKGGLNFSNSAINDQDVTESVKSLTNLQFGLTSDFKLGKLFYLSPDLLYSMKGYKVDVGKFMIDYIEIPVDLTFHVPLCGISLFAQAGPYVGYGVSSKYKVGGQTTTIHFGSGADQIKRMDFGGNIGGGIELGKLQLGVRYELGLYDIDNVSGTSTKNRVFSATLALFF
ncbi:MAG: porin family protein [Bacteroidota bacterium]|nr:porin family protein [Bacteroidota bacterium]